MTRLRYGPDEWAHNLDQWWAPLAQLAGQDDCESAAWLNVLGVKEFFDHRLLGQVHLRTPWLCVAACGLAASGARGWARAAAEADDSAVASAKALAEIALRLAVELEALRWRGVRLGENVISTTGLIAVGRSALSRTVVASAESVPDSLSLVAGWLVHSGGSPARLHIAGLDPQAAERSGLLPGQAVAQIAQTVLGQRGSTGALGWGVAHLVERLAAGTLDLRTGQPRPDNPPTRAWANVLLVSDQGEVGVFEARRQHSLLEAPSDIPVPDLARLAFTHVTADCMDSITDAFTAARSVRRLGRPGELISWSLQLRHRLHPLAERTVSGRSAALGAYVAFRSLTELGVFAGDGVAFTGQVSPDGNLGEVQGASGKIDAAADRGISRVVCPMGQEWQDPDGRVIIEPAERAEDAVITTTNSLRDLRHYLEAACRLVAPEPWLQTWLDNHGRAGVQMPLLDVMCRHVHRHRVSVTELDAASLDMTHVASEAGLATPGADTTVADSPNPPEPEIAPCPAHMLATKYPDVSFVVTADAGCGCTVTAKRMVAEAAREAIERLRAIGSPGRMPVFSLPLYVPLGALPSSWDDLIQTAVDALPPRAETTLMISAALASALQGDGRHEWRALVVADGTDRAARPDGQAGLEEVGDFVELITAGLRSARRGWQPSRPPQIVLCGRGPSPAHRKAAQALRARRPGAVATMGLEPLADREIDRFVAAMPGMPLLGGNARELARSPLLLAISVIAGHTQAGECGPVDLFHRAIEVLLGGRDDRRRLLAEIAFRAALAKGEPVGDFTLADVAGAKRDEVESALASDDGEGAFTLALRREERDTFRSAVNETHLLTASGGGWRFFHDRAFSFLVADCIARHAVEDPGDDDDHFAVLGPHLGDPLWADVIEATGRLLELRAAGGPSCAE